MKFVLSEDFEINYDDYAKDGLRVAILARSGAGKSNLAALFVEQALDQGLQVVIIEPIDEYYTLKELYDVAWVGESGDLPLVPERPEVYVHLLEKGISCIFTVSTGDEQTDKDFVANLLWVLYSRWKSVRRPLLVVIEEADMYAPQMWTKADRLCLSRMALIAKRGRKLGINTVVVSQRPADIHKSVISQANVLFIGGFKTTQDLNSVRQLSNLLHMEIPTEVVAALRPGEFYAIAGGEIRLIRTLLRRSRHGGETPSLSLSVRNREAATVISELAEVLKQEMLRIREERDELSRLRRENEELRQKIMEYEEQLRTLKIVKEVPLEIKATYAQSAEGSVAVPEIIHRCRYPGAFKVYLYLRGASDYQTIKEISASTGLSHEQVRRIIRWMRNKGLVKVQTSHYVGRKEAIKRVKLKDAGD